MKKVVFILAVICTLVSCNNSPKYSGMHGEKTQKDAEAEFTSALSSADSTAVLNLAEKCMTLLSEGQVTEAVDMIHVLYNNVVYKKSDSYTAELISRFKLFPVVSYKLNYFSFSTEGNNDISYTYAFGPADASGSAPEMKLMFNPVFVDGEWFLTFKDGSQSSRDLPKDKQIHEMAPAPKDITVNRPAQK